MHFVDCVFGEIEPGTCVIEVSSRRAKHCERDCGVGTFDRPDNEAPREGKSVLRPRVSRVLGCHCFILLRVSLPLFHLTTEVFPPGVLDSVRLMEMKPSG